MTLSAPAAPTVGIARTCGCFGGKRHPPIRIHPAVAAQLREALRLLANRTPPFVPRLARGLGAVLEPPEPAYGHLLAQVLLDYRCPTCKQVVDLTVRDLLGEPG